MILERAELQSGVWATMLIYSEPSPHFFAPQVTLYSSPHVALYSLRISPDWKCEQWKCGT